MPDLSQQQIVEACGEIAYRFFNGLQWRTDTRVGQIEHKVSFS